MKAHKLYRVIPFLVFFSYVNEAKSAPGPEVVLKAWEWMLSDEGRAYQNKITAAIGGQPFEVASPAIPFFLENKTSSNLTFSLESDSCDRTQLTLSAYSYSSFDCPTTNGDDRYNIYFQDKSYTIYGAGLYVFETNQIGKLDLFDYTHVLDKQD